MNNINWSDPMIVDILGNGEIEVPVSGGAGWNSIGGGLYTLTLPDGRIVTADEFGNILSLQ